jgi:hypothetical protein
MRLSALLVFAFLGLAIADLLEIAKPAFRKCDQDNSQGLSYQEFSSCVIKQLNQNANIAKNKDMFVFGTEKELTSLFNLVDQNKDGTLSLNEYAKIFARAQDPRRGKDTIEVRTKDGKTKTVTQDELLDNLRDQMQVWNTGQSIITRLSMDNLQYIYHLRRVSGERRTSWYGRRSAHNASAKWTRRTLLCPVC